MVRIAGPRSSGEFGGLHTFTDSNSIQPIGQKSTNQMQRTGAVKAANQDALVFDTNFAATTSGQVKLKSRPFTGVTRQPQLDNLRQGYSQPSGASDTLF